MPNKIQDDKELIEIDRLNLEAWQARIYDSNRAYEISKDVVAKSRQLNYRKGLAEGLRTCGFCLIRVSMHKEAESCLLEALSLFV
jgi:hypothetical protein